MKTLAFIIGSIAIVIGIALKRSGSTYGIGKDTQPMHRQNGSFYVYIEGIGIILAIFGFVVLILTALSL